MKMSDRTLSIQHVGKNIPYRARTDDKGRVNYGFTALKGHPERVGDIKEVAFSPALGRVVKMLANARSPLFSGGCDWNLLSDGERFQVTGYLEVVHNSKVLVQHPEAYFKLFFDFSALDIELKGSYHWMIETIRFLDADSLEGWSVVIYVSTDGLATSADEARHRWDAAVDDLGNYLSQVQASGEWASAADRIY